MRAVRQIIRGCGYVEGYGSHPGTPWMLLLLLLGALAGGWLGVFVLAMAFGPLYLFGAYERGEDTDR